MVEVVEGVFGRAMLAPTFPSHTSPTRLTDKTEKLNPKEFWVKTNFLFIRLQFPIYCDTIKLRPKLYYTKKYASLVEVYSFRVYITFLCNNLCFVSQQAESYIFTVCRSVWFGTFFIFRTLFSKRERRKI